MPKNVGLHKGMVMIHGLRAELELFKEIWTAILNFKMAYITDTFLTHCVPKTKIRVLASPAVHCQGHEFVFSPFQA